MAMTVPRPPSARASAGASAIDPISGTLASPPLPSGPTVESVPPVSLDASDASAPASAAAPHIAPQWAYKQTPRPASAGFEAPPATGPRHAAAEAMVVAPPRFARHSRAATAVALHAQSPEHVVIDAAQLACKHDSQAPLPASRSAVSWVPTASQALASAATTPHATWQLPITHEPRPLSVVSDELTSGATQVDTEATVALPPRSSMQVSAPRAVAL